MRNVSKESLESSLSYPISDKHGSNVISLTLLDNYYVTFVSKLEILLS